MKQVKPIFFHGTTEKNLESILKTGAIKTSSGRYGQGVYCASTINEALEKSYGDSVLGIQVYGLEKKAVMPLNKLFKWLIFKEDIPTDFIKYAIIFDEERKEMSIEKENSILWIYSPVPLDIFKRTYYNKLTNIIFRDFNSYKLPNPRQNRIKVTEPYKTEVNEDTPSLEEFLKDKMKYYADYYQKINWNNYKTSIDYYR